MTVKQLLTGMDSREFTEWQCFFTVMSEKIEEETKDRESKIVQSQISSGLIRAKAYRKANK